MCADVFVKKSISSIQREFTRSCEVRVCRRARPATAVGGDSFLGACLCPLQEWQEAGKLFISHGQGGDRVDTFAMII